MADLTAVSRYMSYLLRHHPESGGFTLDEHGWAPVRAVLAALEAKAPMSMALLEEIVRTDEKQRYSFNADKTMIRANQGHSVPVDVEPEERQPPEILYHGTGMKYVESINRQGLLPQSRLYVHLTDDYATALRVGERHGKPFVYLVAAENMYRNGYRFYLSSNGVWLTKVVPAAYLITE